ncbi:MAG TPA: hypothetical protein VGI43_02855 [Mucilaginibacter sp.]|jgi:flavin reductase (DIM6/NTAB) family NADH-FMN oxidoreductase RutF
MNALIKKLFFKDTKIKTFFITRLAADEVEEKVFLTKDKHLIEISRHHGMICLDPFCVAVWLTDEESNLFDLTQASIHFKKGNKLNAAITVSFIEKIPTAHGELVLYKVEKVVNHQLNPLHRLVLFTYLLRSKASTYYSRRVISALYSYPRSIIIVSYKDDEYCNIFPMDIHAYVEEENLYILGLRTTNITLNKILDARKVVVCDTDAVDIDTVYSLGKHSSNSPTPKEQLPFTTAESEVFNFPVPDFTGSYKEIEIIHHRKMGYHMLMVGRVVNAKKIKQSSSSLYHVGFLQFQTNGYKSIEGVF